MEPPPTRPIHSVPRRAGAVAAHAPPRESKTKGQHTADSPLEPAAPDDWLRLRVITDMDDTVVCSGGLTFYGVPLSGAVGVRRSVLFVRFAALLLRSRQGHPPPHTEFQFSSVNSHPELQPLIGPIFFFEDEDE